MIKKTITVFILLIVLTISVGSYKYLLIRKGFHIYFMAKNPGTFEEIYYNVTDWKFTDYAKHPKVSAFLLKKKIMDK